MKKQKNNPLNYLHFVWIGPGWPRRWRWCPGRRWQGMMSLKILNWYNWILKYVFLAVKINLASHSFGLALLTFLFLTPLSIECAWHLKRHPSDKATIHCEQPTNKYSWSPFQFSDKNCRMVKVFFITLANLKYIHSHSYQHCLFLMVWSVCCAFIF